MEQFLTANISGRVRRVNEGGKSYLVAPASTVEVAIPTLTSEYVTGARRKLKLGGAS